MSDNTLEQFGEQWGRFGSPDGYFGSLAVLRDLCGPLLQLEQLRDRPVLEVGSGNGRIVKMLLEAGAARVIAVEPSAGIEALKRNTREQAERICYLQVTGEQLPEVSCDLAFCIGVLHHIRDPGPTVRRVRQVLRPGGSFLIWVYGREGNGAYIAFAELLRKITRRVPDPVLAGLAHGLNLLLGVYVRACRVLPLPLARYMREVMSRFDRKSRFFLIFDQLNCGYAKYYTREEAYHLLSDAGFENVRLHHRHGMSWTAIGEAPASGAQSLSC